jgi:hypothetical protein
MTENRWTLIIDRHPEIEPHQRRLTEAVAKPDRWRLGSGRDEEWFYLADAGPSRWLKVVVRYEGQEGWIVTAFARRSFP